VRECMSGVYERRVGEESVRGECERRVGEEESV
jgi:hypothetical protein